jgi:hypothetical protein
MAAKAPTVTRTAVLYQGKYKSGFAWVLSVTLLEDGKPVAYEHVRVGHVGEPEDLVRGRVHKDFPGLLASTRNTKKGSK